jgi:hypothetical protein
MGATSKGQDFSLIIEAEIVKGSHVDNQVTRIRQAKASKRMASSKSISLDPSVASTLKREGDFIARLGEGDGCRVRLEPLLELHRFCAPCAISLDNIANTSFVEAFGQDLGVVLGQNSRAEGEKSDGKASERV